MKYLLVKAAVSVAIILFATGVARRFPIPGWLDWHHATYGCFDTRMDIPGK